VRPDRNDAPRGSRRRRVALLLEYEGTGFAGSQLQAGARTVQGVLEDALEKATGERERVAFAGRTDAGVHALGQVAALSTGSALEPETLLRALNAWLPEDVAVLRVQDVEPGFDPRRGAVRRSYRYVIENRPVRPALERGRVWHVPGDLDMESMRAAAAGLVGRRDFAAFASRLEEEGKSTVREVYRFDVSDEGSRIFLDVEANAFLPHQVRRMAGALVEVGRRKLTPAEYVGLLDGPPASAGPAAPARGLYLVRVDYARDLFARALSSSRKMLCTRMDEAGTTIWSPNAGIRLDPAWRCYGRKTVAAAGSSSAAPDGAGAKGCWALTGSSTAAQGAALARGARQKREPDCPALRPQPDQHPNLAQGL